MTEFHIFWETYPADLCNRKGSRKKAEQLWDKIASEVQDQALLNMREMMRVDRKVRKTGEFIPKWPMVTTWLNGERWEDIHDIKQSHDIKIDARKCDCGADTEIVNQCWNCFNKTDIHHKKHMRMLYDELIRIGMEKQPDETKPEWALRCKEFLRQKGYLGTVIPER